MINFFCFKIVCFCLPLSHAQTMPVMSENNNNKTTTTQTTQTEQTPATPPQPPTPTAFKQPSGELRENVNRGETETRQVDTHKNSDK